MASLKDQAVNLILSAKNRLSSETDAAADSVQNLGENAQALQDRLRALEDQGRLVRQFQQAEKAVSNTGKAWDRAKIRVTRLQEQIERSGEATASQAAALELATKTARDAEAEYKKSERILEELGEEAGQAGLNLEDLNAAQKRNQKETIAARRALQDLNREQKEGTSRILAFRRGLSDSIVTLGKWGAAAAVGLLTRFTAQQADLARQTLATAEALGIGTDELQAFQYAASRFNIENDKAADILKDVSEKIGDAYLTGGGEAREVIQGLGLDIEKLARLSPDQQLATIGRELDKLGSRSNKIFVLEALASDASLLLPLLENNTAELTRLQEQARKRGSLVSEADLQALKDTDDAFQQIRDRLDQVRNKVAAELAPTFTELAEDFEGFLASNPKLIGDIAGVLGGLIERTRDWVGLLLDNRDEITGGLQAVVDTAQFLGNTLLGVFRTTQALGAGIQAYWGALAAGVSKAIELAVKGANNLGLASDEAVRRAEFRTQNLKGTMEDLWAKTVGYAEAAVDAGKSAVSAFDNTSKGAGKAAGVIQGAVSAAKDLVGANRDAAEGAKSAAENTEGLARQQDVLARQIADTALAIAEMEAAWEQDGSEAAAQRLEELRKRYKALQDQLRGLSEDQQQEAPGGSGLVQNFQQVSGAADDATDATKRTFQQVVFLQDELQETGRTAKEAGDTVVESAGSVGAAIGAIGDRWANYLSGLSSRAAEAFQQRLGFRQATADASALEQQLSAVEGRLADMDKRVTGGGSVARLLRSWAEAGFETERAFLEQAIAVEKLTDRILSGDRAVKEIDYSADQLTRRFDLLDGSQLRPLIGAIQSARREISALNDSIIDTVNAAEQELAALRGDTAEVERLRFLERQTELQEQLDKARKLGDRETIANAEKALKLTEEAYELRKQQALEAEESARQRRAELEAERASRTQDEEREERQDVSRTERRSQEQVTQLDRAVSSTRVTLDLRVQGEQLGTLDGVDPAQVQRLLESIEANRFLTTG